MANSSRRLPVGGISGALPAPTHIDVLNCWPGRAVKYEIPEGTARAVITAADPFTVRPNGAPTVEYDRDTNSWVHVLDGTGGATGTKFDWLVDGVASLVFVACPVTGGLNRQVPVSIACYRSN